MQPSRAASTSLDSAPERSTHEKYQISTEHPSYAGKVSSTKSAVTAGTSNSALATDVVGVEDADTSNVFLSILFDMNDLRLDVTQRTDGAEVNIDSSSSASPSQIAPRRINGVDTASRSDVIIAHSSEQELSKSTAGTEACLANRFCTLPTSSGILTNHYPWAIQEEQLRRLTIPTWALMCLHQESGRDTVTAALTSIPRKLATRLREGESWKTLVGPHPHIAALSDASKFSTAPILSQWAAGMVHSVRNRGEQVSLFLCAIFLLTRTRR